MSEFKPGDKVTIKDEYANKNWKLGDIFIVVEPRDTWSGRVSVAYDSAGKENGWMEDYFELVEDAVPTHDRVNHPEHYISDPSGVECIQITRHRNFNIGNAIKYLWRNGLKTSSADPKEKQIEDLKKAVWYINDEIARLEKEKA